MKNQVWKNILYTSEKGWWLNLVETGCVGTRWSKMRGERGTLGLVVVSRCGRDAQTPGQWALRGFNLKPAASSLYHPLNFQVLLFAYQGWTELRGQSKTASQRELYEFLKPFNKMTPSFSEALKKEFFHEIGCHPLARDLTANNG